MSLAQLVHSILDSRVGRSHVDVERIGIHDEAPERHQQSAVQPCKRGKFSLHRVRVFLGLRQKQDGVNRSGEPSHRLRNLSVRHLHFPAHLAHVQLIPYQHTLEVFSPLSMGGVSIKPEFRSARGQQMFRDN